MGNLPLFVDREVKQGEENLYTITDLGNGQVRINFVGTIVTPGSRINAAALNPFVHHVNDPNIHVPRAEISALETRIQTLEDAVLNDFNHNLFRVSFGNPVGVRIKRGWFDPDNARLVIK
ncbi:hypothetical protein HN020_09135 [Brevibacillus borstelensis]|uniref:hypothetical protein n=1 Tax=Brevibacillus borstelensis TaxID=45462 RepID=UPI0004692574|nr:hypothetical protein [Brevibacillus borstelensis]KKX52503.1 hypothetical protein X546_25165 [Brevibacillus borstelensis cifa_chp40]NOU54911.1 hypothetical protein [Brevibacillus borstelensis]